MSPELEKFFIVTQPGLEDQLERELQEIWPFILGAEARPHAQVFTILERDVGGLLIECSRLAGLQVNFFSKLASRVLLRWDSFKVRDFAKLNDRLRHLRLLTILPTDVFRVEVAAAKSRLNNEKKIIELAKKIWPRAKFETGDEGLPAVLIRLYDDICTISIDTSGKHLHFRECQKLVGEAPLRETLAAFCVRHMIQDLPLASLNQITLCDPMAGSGTFLKEASSLYQGNFARGYQFQNFPTTPKLLKLKELPANYPQTTKLIFKAYVASDFDSKQVAVLRKNLEGLAVEIRQADFFKAEWSNVGPHWLILNPPYGERLPFPEGFYRLGERMNESLAERLGILLPWSQVTNFANGLTAKGNKFRLKSKAEFKNGGLPVQFHVYTKD